jgi:mono/diheme cytochrome c family protein
MKRSLQALAVASVLSLGVITASAADKKLDPSKLPPAATSATPITYEKDIKPIFEKSCVKCHSGDKPKSKLDLTTLANAIKGGKNAPNIVPGKSGESTMVYAIANIGDEDDFMPPPNNKAKIAPLTKEQIGIIRAWIDQGAK